MLHTSLSWYMIDTVMQSMSWDAGDPGLNCALGKQWSRVYLIDVPATPMLPNLNANLHHQEALNWHKWTKGESSFLLFWSAEFWSSCHDWI